MSGVTVPVVFIGQRAVDLAPFAVTHRTTDTALCETTSTGGRPAHRAETSGMTSEVCQVSGVVVHGLISIRVIGLCQRTTRTDRSRPL